MNGVDVDANDLGLLNLIARTLAADVDAGVAVEIAVRQAITRVGADGGVAASLSPGGTVRPMFTVGYPPSMLAAFGRMRIEDKTPLAAALRTGEAVWLSDRAEAEAHFPEFVSGPVRSHAWAAVPMHSGGTPSGVLALTFAQPTRLSESERAFLCLLADLTSLAWKAQRVLGRSDIERVAATLNYLVGGCLTLASNAIERGLADVPEDSPTRRSIAVAGEHLAEADGALSLVVDDLLARGHREIDLASSRSKFVMQLDPEDFNATILEFADGTVLALSGCLDVRTQEDLKSAITDAVTTWSQPLQVDLTEVTFIDTWGLRVLIDARDKLVVRATSAPVARLLRLTGVQDLFGESAT